MAHQVLALKWRPSNFNEVVGQPHVVRILSNALTQNRLHHAYLFTGTRGVGKTSIARIFAKCLNCEQGISAQPCNHCPSCIAINNGNFIDLIEIDAASKTKVEDTRQLLDNVAYSATNARYKIYLIDEIHMLSTHSFNALLKTLEEPPAHVKFLLATTDPQKLPDTILSRCLQFQLKPMPNETIVQQLTQILDQEKVGHELAALQAIAHAARGSLRDALSLLEQNIAYGNGQISTASVTAALGIATPSSVVNLLQQITDKDISAMLGTINTLAEQALDFQQVLNALLSLLHEIALTQALPSLELHNSTYDAVARQSLAQSLSAETVQLYYQIALIGQRDLPLAPTAKAGLEMIVLRMMAFHPMKAISAKKQATPRPTMPTMPTKASTVTATPKMDPPDWSTLLDRLPLTGMVKSLANHLTFQRKQDQTIYFTLQQKHHALLSNQRHTQLNQALITATTQDIVLDIQVVQPDAEPINSAPIGTEHDANINALLNAFDGKITEE